MTGDRIKFQLGEWLVDAELCELRNRHSRPVSIQPRVMDVLLCLAEAEGRVVSRQKLIDTVWEGRPTSDEPINRCVAELRAALGDDRNNPRYIRTIHKRGYQLLPEVKPFPDKARAVRGRELAGTGMVVVAAASLSMVLSLGHWDPSRISSTSGEPRLLVSPITTADISEKARLLADAMTDALVVNLASLEGAVVMSGDTSREIAERGQSGADVAEVNPDYRLEGRLFGDSMSWTLDLFVVDAASGVVLFSQERKIDQSTLERTLHVIVRDVSQFLGLTEQAGGTERELQVLDSDSYRDFIEARNLARTRSETRARQAVVRLDRVIRKYPEFAPAYAQRAAANLVIGAARAENEPDYAPLVHADVQAALSLDERQPLARAVKARSIENDEPLEAMRQYEELLEEFPSQLDARLWYALLLYRFGFLVEALDHLHYIYEREPLSPMVVTWLADATLAVGDYQGFDHLYATDMPRKIPFSDVSLFIRAMVDKDKERAIRHLQDCWGNSMSVTPGELALVVEAVFDPALHDEGVALVEDMLDRPRSITRWWGFIFLDLLGEHAAAVALYDDIEPTGGQRRVMYQVWSAIHADLRRSPVFLEFMRKFGIDGVWRERGAGFRCSIIAGGRLDCSKFPKEMRPGFARN